MTEATVTVPTRPEASPTLVAINGAVHTAMAVMLCAAVIVLVLIRWAKTPPTAKKRGWLFRSFIGGWLGAGPDTGRSIEISTQQPQRQDPVVKAKP